MKKFLVTLVLAMLLWVPNAFADTVAGDPLLAPLIEDDLEAVNTALDEDILTYETGGSKDFEWHSVDEMIAIATLTDTYIFVGNGSNNPVGVAVSGDVGISDTGVTAIGADKVKDTMVDWGSGADQVDLADIPGGISGANVWDFGGATSFELPQSNTPTTDAAGEIALDTTITNHKPLFQYYSGAENMTVVALPTANLNSTDNYILKYDAASDAFRMEEDAGSGGAGGGSFGPETAKTISSGVVDASGGENFIGLAGEGGAVDTLSEIQCAAAGDIIVLSNPNAASYTITVQDGTYLKLQADFALDSVDDTITMICSSIGANDTCREIARASNS